MIGDLFAQALDLRDPWVVRGVTLEREASTLVIEIDFERGSRFAVPGEEGLHVAYDTQMKQYRHLNFFQHKCYLNVYVPRVRLPDGRLHTIVPEWSGKLQGFTMLMEAYVVLLLDNGMSMSEADRTLDMSAYQVKTILLHYTQEAIAAQDISDVERLAIDETSKARGHDYITVVADADQRRVIEVQPGRTKESLAAAAASMEARGCSPLRITDVCTDMSLSYIYGTRESFPNAVLTTDKFHVVAAANRALDLTRREEVKHNAQLKGARWALLKDESNLTDWQGDTLATLTKSLTFSRTARAYQYKEQLREILQGKQPNVVTKKLRLWCSRVRKSLVTHMHDVADMIIRHLEAIVAWTRSRLTNGFLESLHSKFQAAKRKAKGYSSIATIRAMYYLLAGKLDFGHIFDELLPT